MRWEIWDMRMGDMRNRRYEIWDEKCGIWEIWDMRNEK